MKVNLLMTEERVALGASHRIVITQEDLTQTTVNTAQVIKLLDIPAGGLVRNVYTKLQARFANTADTDLNTTALTIGDAGTANLFLASQELNVNGTEVRFKAGTGTQKAYDAAAVLNATFGSMALKSLADLNAGEVHIFVELIDVGNYDGAVI